MSFESFSFPISHTMIYRPLLADLYMAGRLNNSSSPGIIFEIRWYPAHKGVAGNEKADEWAKAAAEQAGNHRPILQSLANLKREISEKK